MTEQDLERRLMAFSRRFFRGMARLFAPLLQEYGITAMQVQMLLCIQEFGTTTVSALSQSMQMGLGNCSAACKKMERAGLLSRRRSKCDERRVELELSEAGARLIRELFHRLHAAALEEMPDRTPEQLEAIIESLDNIEALLEKVPEAPGKRKEEEA